MIAHLAAALGQMSPIPLSPSSAARSAPKITGAFWRIDAGAFSHWAIRRTAFCMIPSMRFDAAKDKNGRFSVRDMAR
jgi:hypothetical protein